MEEIKPVSLSKGRNLLRDLVNEPDYHEFSADDLAKAVPALGKIRRDTAKLRGKFPHTPHPDATGLKFNFLRYITVGLTRPSFAIDADKLFYQLRGLPELEGAIGAFGEQAQTELAKAIPNEQLRALVIDERTKQLALQALWDAGNISGLGVSRLLSSFEGIKPDSYKADNASIRRFFEDDPFDTSD